MGFFWLGSLIVSLLVIASGAIVLGTSAGLAVGALWRSSWVRVVVAVLGCGAGLFLGVTYWLDHVATIRGRGEVEVGRAVWNASWPLGLGMLVAGGVLSAVALILRRDGAEQRPETRPSTSPLTGEPCFLCGRRLRADEVEARVCRACRM